MRGTFPEIEWDHGSSSVADDDQLATAMVHARRHGSRAMMVVESGQVIASFGDLTEKLEVASARKSLLSALYGIFIGEGIIDPSRTLDDLDIDDFEPLSDAEKQATIRHLLMSRSGVYRDAAFESRLMRRRRPRRGSHQAGEYWYYNNWDFNALGTIFEQLVGTSVHAAFEDRIARPIGMQDYTTDDGYYLSIEASEHRAYRFKMSTRDLARFGLLFARRGRWGDDQVVPEGWVDESTIAHTSEAQQHLDFGYSWWIGRPQNASGYEFYAARGGAGHAVLVVPSLDLVIVHRVLPDPRVPNSYWRLPYSWSRIGPRRRRVLPSTILNRTLDAAIARIERRMGKRPATEPRP